MYWNLFSFQLNFFSLIHSLKMASAVRSKVLKVLNKQKNGFISTTVRQKSSIGPEKNILTSVFKDLPATNYTVNDFVWQHLDRWPDKTATVSYHFVLCPAS